MFRIFSHFFRFAQFDTDCEELITRLFSSSLVGLSSPLFPVCSHQSELFLQFRRLPWERSSLRCAAKLARLQIELSLSLFFLYLSLILSHYVEKSVEKPRACELNCCPFPWLVARLIVQKPAFDRRESSELESGSKHPGPEGEKPKGNL